MTKSLCCLGLFHRLFTSIVATAHIHLHLVPRPQIFSLRHRVQTGSGTQAASYPMGTGGSYSGGKKAAAWSWPLTSIFCRVKNAWTYTSTPPLRLQGVVLS